jgi:hypothetical protein
MAKKFEEYIQVKLPMGAKEALAKLASTRYESTASLARKAIMAEIEKAKPKVA